MTVKIIHFRKKNLNIHGYIRKAGINNMKKSNILTMAICTIILSAAAFCGGAAAAGNKSVSYQSQGKIVFNNNTAQTADDVIFDASDFQTIDDMVTAGKIQIGIELNKYPSINLDLNNTVPSFGDLSNAVSILTNDVNADGSKMLKDYTAYVKGSKIQGTIESKAAATYTPSTSDQTINQGIYLSGAQTIKGDKNLTAANILENKTIFGVAGTHKCAVTPTQTKTVTPSTKEQTITLDTGKLLSSVTVSAISTQTKTATPGSTEQTISPDTGKYLTSVKVSAVSTQTKTATPGSAEQTISPDTGKYLSSVTVEAIDTQTKSATPGVSEQTITPDEGKYLSSVTVSGDEDLLAENIKSGVQIFGVTGTLSSGSTGNFENKKLITKGRAVWSKGLNENAWSDADSDSYTIPMDGYYWFEATATYNSSSVCTNNGTKSINCCVQYLSGSTWKTLSGCSDSNIPSEGSKTWSKIKLNSGTKVRFHYSGFNCTACTDGHSGYRAVTVYNCAAPLY